MKYVNYFSKYLLKGQEAVVFYNLYLHTSLEKEIPISLIYDV